MSSSSIPATRRTRNRERLAGRGILFRRRVPSTCPVGGPSNGLFKGGLAGRTKAPLAAGAVSAFRVANFQEDKEKGDWSGRWDSNPRPQPWQGCALPLSYTRTLRPAGRYPVGGFVLRKTVCGATPFLKISGGAARRSRLSLNGLENTGFLPRRGVRVVPGMRRSKQNVTANGWVRDHVIVLAGRWCAAVCPGCYLLK